MTAFSLFWGFLAKDHLQLILIIALFFVVSSDKPFEKKARNRLYITLAMITVCLVFDYFDIAVGALDRELCYHEIVLRTHSVIMEHIFHPFLLAMCVSFVYRPKNRRIMLAFSFPAFANIVLQLLSIPFDWALSVSPNNTVQYHPVHYVYVGICAFYLFFFLIIPIVKWKSLSKQERYVFIFIVLSLIICFIVDSFGLIPDFHSMPTCIITSFLLYYIFLYTKKSKEEIKQKNMEAELNRNALLLSQMKPHFLLNTLNAIYSLYTLNPEAAQDAVLAFSAYLRSNLEIGKDGEPVSVENEIAHAKHYAQIEKMRFPDIETVFDIRDGSYSVPPLIVQPMVENAIRHGVRGLPGAKVEITLTKEQDKNNKYFHQIVIHDNGNGKSRSNSSIATHTGIGIPNVRERVQKAGGTFDIVMSEKNGTTVTIRFPE